MVSVNSQLVKMTGDPKLIELTADVFRSFWLKYCLV